MIAEVGKSGARLATTIPGRRSNSVPPLPPRSAVLRDLPGPLVSSWNTDEEPGANSAPPQALRGMTESCDSQRPTTPLEDLVTQLLACGAVVSQIIGHMLEFQASGRSAPDAAPIPEVAHSLIHGVITDLTRRYSKGQIRTAARIVEVVTDRICEEIMFVPPELVDVTDSGDELEHRALPPNDRRNGHG